MKVFLSYSRRDKDIAGEVRAALEACGHEVWQDETSVPGGAFWRAEIEKGIRGTDTFVILLSSAVLRAPDYPRQELDLARHHDRMIVPVRVRPMKELPEGFALTLSGIERIDLFPSLKNGVEQLLRVLEPVEQEASNEETPTLGAVARHRFVQLKKRAHELRMESKQRELGKKALKIGGALAAAGAAVATGAANARADERERTAQRDRSNAEEALKSYRKKVVGLFGGCANEFGRLGEYDMSISEYKEGFRPNVRYLLGQLTATEPPNDTMMRAHRRLVHDLEDSLNSFDIAVAKIEKGEEHGAKLEMDRMLEKFFNMLESYAMLLEEQP